MQVMDLIRLIYCSRPFGFDDAALNGILIDARRCNERDAITGALICRADIYLQLLEGPAAAVDATFARIAKDNRHLEVNLLSRVCHYRISSRAPADQVFSVEVSVQAIASAYKANEFIVGPMVVPTSHSHDATS